MKRLFVQLTIGEKIGFSFGFVGMLFLAVIWQYHITLERSLADYQQLQDVYWKKKGYALEIENSMLEARQSEKAFLLQKDENHAAAVKARADQVLELAAALEQVDTRDSETGRRIGELMRIYNLRFQAIAEAWRIKGLDHNSGLQGAFRDSAHKLEDLAGEFKVDGLYLQLLQIRRAEKDLGLRQELEYRDKVVGLVREFRDKIEVSGLTAAIKAELLRETDAYLKAFENYSLTALSHEDIQGGTGPFRQAAHRIEALLHAHYIPDLESKILQLRRREKDYLLRGDRRYVDLALSELDKMNEQVSNASVSEQDKSRLHVLLADYRRDFLALVEQNTLISNLQDEMREAVTQIAPIVRNNVQDTDRAMTQVTAEIYASSEADAKLTRWIVTLAILLGILFAVAFTLSIARPLRRMAGLLDQLAYDVPVERVSVLPGGRDEVNAMAQSVNAMADHKARFIAWWKKTMREAEGVQKVQTADDSQQHEDAEHELQDARKGKEELLRDMHQEIRAHTNVIVENAELLLKMHPHGTRYDETKQVEQSGKSVLTLLDMMQSERPVNAS